MVSLNGTPPKSHLPDNVFFCNLTTYFDEHSIDIDYLATFIMDVLTNHI